MEVRGRGAGRAVIYRGGSYLGYVQRIGSTGWQAWRVRPNDVHAFVGWSATRFGAASKLRNR